MAKYEKNFEGDFNEVLEWVDNDISRGSVSASFEDGSDINVEQVRIAVRVYERYSMIGGNRVSLNITLVGNGRNLFISAITSGGSQAVLFKVNTLGEESFLDMLYSSVENYIMRAEHSPKH